MNAFITEIVKRPHPAIVHFPISLYPASLLFSIIYNVEKTSMFLDVAYWCFILAAVFLIPISVTGLLDYFRLKEHSRKAHRLLLIHLFNGIVITVIGVAACLVFWLNPPISNREMIPSFIISAALLSLLVLLQGAIAALMVYQYKLGIDGETR